MIISLENGVFLIGAYSRRLRESRVTRIDQPLEWYWTGEGWHPTSVNAKTFSKMLDAMGEMATILNLPD